MNDKFMLFLIDVVVTMEITQVSFIKSTDKQKFTRKKAIKMIEF